MKRFRGVEGSLKFFSQPGGPFVLVLYLVCISILFRPPVAAAGNFSITMENDFFGSAGTDRYFTNGLNLTFVDDPAWCWLEDLARLSHGPALGTSAPRLVSTTLGQDIYTPQDIEAHDLIEDDRPYAGWLYLGLGVHERSSARTHEAGEDTPRWQVQDSTEIILGMIGPQSYAGDVQYWWHEKVIGFNNTREPSGWDNQLANEPAFALLRERKWRLRNNLLDSPWLIFDFIPHLGAAAGTVTTYASAGGEARLGWWLPDDFGSAKHRAGLSPTRISSPHWTTKNGCGRQLTPVSFHLFSKVEGRGVLRDIFLDGNTFTDSHSVNRKPLIFSVLAGASILFGQRIEAIFTHVYQSKEFDGQDLAHVFGTLTISFYW
jgi:hypothetical protein